MATGEKVLRLSPCRKRRTNDDSGSNLIIQTHCAIERSSGIIREARRVYDFQGVAPSAAPDVDAARTAMLQGEINLHLDSARSYQATLDSTFSQQGNLARRGEQVVGVIRLNRLASRG